MRIFRFVGEDNTYTLFELFILLRVELSKMPDPTGDSIADLFVGDTLAIGSLFILRVE